MLTDGHVLVLGQSGVSIWSFSRLGTLGEPVPSTPILDSDVKTHLGILPDSTYPHPAQITTDGMVIGLDPVRCTTGSPPSVTFDVKIQPFKADGRYLPTVFHRYTLNGPDTHNEMSFHLRLIGKGFIPDGGRMRNNRINTPCITQTRRTGPQFIDGDEPQTFIYAPSQTLTEASSLGGENLREPSSVNDPEGIMATFLGPFEPLASCWASGRFISFDSDPVTGTNSLALVEYL